VRVADRLLAGKRVWVTGASGGLGREIALAVARAGADVCLFARNQSDLNDATAAVKAEHVDALPVVGSVSQIEDVIAAREAIEERWGGLDALVNNAGISPSMTRAENLAEDEWRAVLDVNLTGAFLSSQQAAKLMLGRGGGSIVNITSVHGTVGMARLAAYSASKGGLELLTRTLAVEWADRRVRVNAVAPGYLETSMTNGLRQHTRLRKSFLDRIPMSRFGNPDEVGALVVYLCSDASGYVTGSSFTIDGGWSAQ
jgi:NAD(P)-dependent dehydrogenase (short-subunit alcohol dehydrogenase family)